MNPELARINTLNALDCLPLHPLSWSLLRPDQRAALRALRQVVAALADQDAFLAQLAQQIALQPEE